MANVLALIIFLTVFLVPSAQADIYVWTDENGIKHFSNYSPPPEAEVMLKTPASSDDGSLHRESLLTEETQNLQRINQEIAEKQLMIALQQEEAEERIAEANRQAEEILEQAETLLEKAQETAANSQDNRTTGYVYGYAPLCSYRYGYNCNPSYYRKDGGIFYYRKDHYRHRYYSGYHRGHLKPPHFQRFNGNQRQNGHYAQRPDRATQRTGLGNRNQSNSRYFGRSGGGGRRF